MKLKDYIDAFVVAIITFFLALFFITGVMTFIFVFTTYLLVIIGVSFFLALLGGIWYTISTIKTGK